MSTVRMLFVARLTLVAACGIAGLALAAGQVTAPEALRKLERQVEFRPRSATWDRELDGSGLEGIPIHVGILTVKETA